MKMTLLEQVQDILSDMNSDNVNSIFDTVEAQQCANMIRSTYYSTITQGKWPHLSRLFRIASSGDNTKPTHMYIEDQIKEIHWVKYDVRENSTDPIKYRDIAWMEPHDFVTHVMSRDASKDNVDSVFDYNGTPLLIINDHAPSYYTTFDDQYLVFDSYNKDVDSTIQHSKTQAYGSIIPEFEMLDEFVIDLPAKAFPSFHNECKSVAFLRIKEVFDAKADDAARKGRFALAREKRRVSNGVRYPNYGRK